MKILNAILAVLLIAAIGMIIKLKQEQQPPPKPAAVTPASDKKANTAKLTEPEILLVLHLDEPVGALQRYYELFPGAMITTIDLGNNQTDPALTKKINDELGVPLTSGKDPFPRTLLDKLIQENKNGQFLHFSSIEYGSSELGIGSKAATTLTCTFPPLHPITGEPVFAQVIPWVKFPGSSESFYNKATQSLGYTPCTTFETKPNEGYILDPQGFITLLQGNQAMQ